MSVPKWYRCPNQKMRKGEKCRAPVYYNSKADRRAAVVAHRRQQYYYRMVERPRKTGGAYVAKYGGWGSRGSQTKNGVRKPYTKKSAYWARFGQLPIKLEDLPPPIEVNMDSVLGKRARAY